MQDYQKVFENQNGYIKPSGGFFFAFLGDGSEMDLFDTLEEAKGYLGEGHKRAPLPASWVLLPSGCDIEVIADREEELQALFAELAEKEVLEQEWKVAA